VNVTVIRESEDRLERQEWSWWVETWSSVSGTFRSYVHGRRPTKRHRKWEAIEWWGRYTYDRPAGGVELQRVDVPVPPDVREEAHHLVVAAIDMEE
jgi:hypothetical protein